MSAGIKTENMDMTVKPGDDFYDYATRGWRNANPIPDDYSRFGAFEVLRNTNLERTREIAETDDGKIGALYKIIMNTEKRNADCVTPVAKYVRQAEFQDRPSEVQISLRRVHLRRQAGALHEAADLYE